MLLRLRQGIGRLIRSSTDHGSVRLWMTEEQMKKYDKQVQAVLPLPINWI